MNNMLIGVVLGGLLALSGCGNATAPALTATGTGTSAMDRLVEAYTSAGGPDVKSRGEEVGPWLTAHPDVADQLVVKCLAMRAETQGAQYGTPIDGMCTLATVASGNRHIDEKLKHYDPLTFGGEK